VKKSGFDLLGIVKSDVDFFLEMLFWEICP
jgi:hypothetical protein